MSYVPFFVNRGHKCAQASLKSILKLKFPEREFSLRELTELTHQQRRQITYPIQIASALAKLGVDFRYYVKPSWIEVFSSRETFVKLVRDYYGNCANGLLDLTELDSLFDCFHELRGNRRVIELAAKPQISDLEKSIAAGEIPLCLVNYDLLIDRQNQFKGHYLILTGYTPSDFICHDSGPKGAAPNKPIPKERFQKAWNLCFFDHDLIII